MDLKQLVVLVLQVSIFATVFGFGLKTTGADLFYLLRRPGLLARSLLSVFVIMPIVTVAFLQLFEFPREEEIILVALAISPLPPILPLKETKAGGNTSYALGLMAILALVSIVAVPLALEILQWVFGRQLGIGFGAIATPIVRGVLVPLLLGVALRSAFPSLAKRLARPVMLVVHALLALGVLALIAGTASQIWALTDERSVLAIVLFTVAGLAIGHLMGGPDHDHSIVLALSTACRHPAIALAIASANFPDQRFGAILLLCLIVNAITGIPYLMWQKRPPARAVRTA